VELTLSAALFLDRMRRNCDLPDSAGLRIAHHPDEAGSRIEVGFVATPEAGDVVVRRAGCRVFVAPRIDAALRNALLDLDRHTIPPELVLRPLPITELHR
jgi:hypothetical protein